MRRRFLLVIAVAAPLLIAGCGDPPAAHRLPAAPVAEAASPSPTPEPTPELPAVVEAIGHYLFFGDIFFGRYINDWSMASDLQYDYPFQRLGEWVPENYNAWVANFECPAVGGLDISSAVMDQTLEFNCDPAYLPSVAKWFTAVDLGNNHTDNQGMEGFATTQENLAAASIQYFGAPDPSNGPNCDVVVLPVTGTLDDGSTGEYPLPFGFCGYDGVFKTPTADEVAEITAFSELLPTIAWPHSGAEYQAGPDEIKTNLYRGMIDAGADMVIGNHAHWIQSTEAYQGKLIVYSMGNFIFDQQAGPEKTRSALIDVTARIDDGAGLEAWSAIAEQCQHDFEACSLAASQEGLTRLQLTYTFDVSGSNNSDRLVKPATSGEMADIKQRLNWDATAAALGQG